MRRPRRVAGSIGSIAGSVILACRQWHPTLTSCMLLEGPASCTRNSRAGTSSTCCLNCNSAGDRSRPSGSQRQNTGTGCLSGASVILPLSILHSRIQIEARWASSRQHANRTSVDRSRGVQLSA